MDRSSTILKVCGMRDGENICAVDALGVDWIGFIFYPHSKRYVGEQLTKTASTAKRVGVFVNENVDTILKNVLSYSLDIVQLHGDESPELCNQLREHQIRVMKAFRIGDSLPLEEIAAYKGCCDYFLFDTHTPNYGGSGRKFDWDILQHYQGNTPFILSGGIGPNDVQKIREFSHTMCIGIDINSKFELSPANKDIQLIKQFIKSWRQ